MESNFLNNLKKAVETGEFNSEAAKKINLVTELSASKTGTEALDKIYTEENIKQVTEEEGALINLEYDKKMSEIQEKDLILQQIKTLIEVEESVAASVLDMKDFIDTLEESFDKLNPNHEILFTEIEKVKSKYSSIINN